MNEAEVFPLNARRTPPPTHPLGAKPLQYLKEPRKAYSQGYHNDIWATSDISSGVNPSGGETQTERKKLGMKLVVYSVSKDRYG